MKTKSSRHNMHGFQFPTYKGSEVEDVDDGSTGELEGVFEGKPVLLSRFEQLPTKSILQDMIDKMDVSKPIAALPALILPDADTMLADVTEGDVEDLQINGP